MWHQLASRERCANFVEEILKRLVLDNVEPGDIIFTARPEKTSKAIRTTTNGDVSHAMICVQRGSFIDSTSDGVQARSLQRELFLDDEKVFHFRLKEKLSPEVMAKIVDLARAEIGARYSTFEAIRSVAAVKKPRSKRQFCSRLVARVYRDAGIDLVPDADYCSPEELRKSPLLLELSAETELVSEEELQWQSDRYNAIQATHAAQNAVLEVARSFDSSVETFNDLFPLLVQRPDADDAIAEALGNSGYLDLWRRETETHPWRYDATVIDAMTSPEQKEALRDYCIGTLKEAYSGGLRFSVNLVQLRALENQSPRKTFRLKISLYEVLVKNDQTRREVAYDWLLQQHPDDLTKYMEQIEPHTAYWFSIVERVEPNLAKLSRHVVSAEGGEDVCSSCGDRPATDYRLVNGAKTMPGVPSLRLCDDCLAIRRSMQNVLVPFLR